MYGRISQLNDIIRKKSIFLLGPRQTGKSTLLRHLFPDAPTYNLLDASLFRSLAADPALIRKEVLSRGTKPEIVVIDEIQRLPELLNEVHLLIEEHQLKFALTGSSARALRRKGVNLLAGRARTLYLHPLVSQEIGPQFDLLRAINQGLLPFLYDSDSPTEDQREYAGVYLREEVAAEGLTRNVPAFSRFLEVAATCNGQILNYTNISGDAEIKRTTVLDYFQILYDTLLAFTLLPWSGSTKRKAIAAPKFYFFDPGISKYLAGVGQINFKSPYFSIAFEHLIFRELRSALDYGFADTLHYWRSTSGFEVDFFFDEKFAIEVKGKSVIRADELKGLRALREEKKNIKCFVIALVEKAQLVDNIEILPWREFLYRLWNRAL
jgi:predicted AAA+ superfamily ATPase